MKKILVLFILTSFVSVVTYAQEKETIKIFEVKHENVLSFKSANNSTVNVPGTGSGTDVTTLGNTYYKVDCDGWGFFSDRAGNHKPYENNRDYYTTICASTSKKGVSVNFQQFKLDKKDKLTVWDEYRTGALEGGKMPSAKDKVGDYTGVTSPGKIVSKKGCLTFRFVSDGSVVKTGWYGKIGCESKPVVDPCVTFNSKVDSELKCGVTIKDDNLRGKNNYEEYGSCTMKGWPSNGRELIYKYVHAKKGDLTFTLKEMTHGQKVLNMHILNDCKVSACVGAITRPAANGKQDVESVTIKNAAAGTYYVAVDGNQKYVHNWFELSVKCSGGSSRLANDVETPLYGEGLEIADNATSFTNDNDQNTLDLAVNKLNVEDLKVIPNPTTGVTMLALDLDQEQSVNLQIFSLAGKLVRNIPLGKTNTIRQEVDLSDLSNGLYILKATGEQSIVTKKIILQK